jgi:hypothetical protein
MRRISSMTFAAALLLPCAAIAQQAPAQQAPAQQAPAPTAPAPQTFTLSGNMVRGYQNLQRNLTEAADKMPEANYSFKPTPDVRPFGQLVAHVALSQFGSCAALKGDAAPPHKDDKEDATRTKTELVALLKESTAYCDPLLTTLKDEDMTTLVKASRRACSSRAPTRTATRCTERWRSTCA